MNAEIRHTHAHEHPQRLLHYTVYGVNTETVLEAYLTEVMLPLHPRLKGRLHLSQLFVLSTNKNAHH